MIFLHLGRIGSRAVQERPSGPPGAVDDFFGQRLEVIAVVIVFLAHDIHQACPSSPQANHLIALAQCPEGDGANGRVQARHVSTPGQNSDHTLFRLDVGHFRSLRSLSSPASLNYAAFRITFHGQRSHGPAISGIGLTPRQRIQDLGFPGGLSPWFLRLYDSGTAAGKTKSRGRRSQEAAGCCEFCADRKPAAQAIRW